MDVMARRLELALEMFDVGVEMVRCRLRRENPDASAAQIEAMVAAWLRQPDDDDEHRILRPVQHRLVGGRG